MTANRDNPLDLEKLKIHERLKSMEDGDKVFRAELRDTMQEIKLRTQNVELMIHGDSTKVDKYTRDGMNRRIEALESVNTHIDKTKSNLIEIGVGSITIAVGGVVIWVINVVREAFIKH